MQGFRGRTHLTRTRVRFGETDVAGIVFYPTFFVWFDVGTSSLRVEHVVLRGEEEAARGFEVRVLVRTGDDGRIAAAPLPPELRAALSDAATTADEVA